MQEYSDTRPKDAHAIIELALGNHVEVGREWVSEWVTDYARRRCGAWCDRDGFCSARRLRTHCIASFLSHGSLDTLWFEICLISYEYAPTACSCLAHYRMTVFILYMLAQALLHAALHWHTQSDYRFFYNRPLSIITLDQYAGHVLANPILGGARARDPSGVPD